MLWFNYMNYSNYCVSKEYGIIFSRVILNIAKNLIFCTLCIQILHYVQDDT